LDGAALDAAIRRRVRVLAKFPDRSRQPTAFLSFLPSKPGSGASTLACGLADALSKDHNTLLCDFDMATGSVAFRYRLESQHAMPEVSEKLEAVDEQLWSQVVSRSGDLDILPSSVRVPTQHPRANQLSKWFEFLRSKYDVVIFDLSGHLEDYTFEVMQHCRQIFLITTQELENLHHARTKADALRRYGLDEQTSVVLNRFQKTHTLKQSDVEDITRMKVRAQFPNDYLALQESVREGGGLKPGTALHKALATFAPNATEMKPPEREAKFVEYFTLPLFNYWRRGNSRSEQWT
jgi:Flp pilus assembly CpaE family ATPase